MMKNSIGLKLQMCYAKVGVCGNPLETCLYVCFYVFNFPFNFLILGQMLGFAGDFPGQTESPTSFLATRAITAITRSHLNGLETTWKNKNGEKFSFARCANFSNPLFHSLTQHSVFFSSQEPVSGFMEITGDLVANFRKDLCPTKKTTHWPRKNVRNVSVKAY